MDIPAFGRPWLPSCALLALIIAVALAGGARSATSAPNAAARITARPATPTESCTPGLRPLGLGAERDGLLFIPATAAQSKPLPLVVLLHGAGGRGERVIRLMQSQAERDGFLLLAPDSRTATWDAIRGSLGPDVVFLNSALERVFAQCAVEPSRLALAGFSDGASYALLLGRLNGDLFTHLMAFSPGVMPAAEPRGKPRIFVSHGTKDKILPIDYCSRVFVPELQREGYRVRYREFKARMLCRLRSSRRPSPGSPAANSHNGPVHLSPPHKIWASGGAAAVVLLGGNS